MSRRPDYRQTAARHWAPHWRAEDARRATVRGRLAAGARLALEILGALVMLLIYCAPGAILVLAVIGALS